MSKTDNGGPAFPVADLAWLEPKNTDEAVRAASGMTLRDYFAAKAMQGMAGRPRHCEHGWDQADLAAQAYEIADAMLEAREVKNGQS